MHIDKVPVHQSANERLCGDRLVATWSNDATDGSFLRLMQDEQLSS